MTSELDEAPAPSAAGLDFATRMSELDAVMWRLEADPMLRSTMTAVSLLDRAPDRARLERRLEAASSAIPRLTQRVRPGPSARALPEWQPDPNFDLGYHVRWIGAPRDGSLRSLLDFTAALAASGFDRSRPLWELVIVEGLEGDAAAMIQKMHHCVTDGVGATRMAAAFFDRRRAGSKPPIARRTTEPSTEHSALHEIVSGAWTDGGRVVELARRALRRAPDVVADPSGIGAELASLVAGVAGAVSSHGGPMSSLWISRSPNSRFDSIAASVSGLKAAARRNGARMNDAFVAALVGGLGRYHADRGATDQGLRMQMPINVRDAASHRTGGNHITTARIEVPLHIRNLDERIREIQNLIASARDDPTLDLLEPAATIANRLPLTVATGMFGAMARSVDFVASNVVGSPVDLYLGGGKVTAIYGFGPLAGGALNATLMSYGDHAFIGLTTDKAAIPDADHLVACLNESFNEMEVADE